jgi:hypothetical protein
MTGEESPPVDDDRVFCECVGTMVRYGWQHAADCLHWSPRLRGPGSTTGAREAAMAQIRATLAETRRRHQADPESPQNGPRQDPGGSGVSAHG